MPVGGLLESRFAVAACRDWQSSTAILAKNHMGTKKSGKGRRKIGRKKRRMRSKIRHRKK
tara:strand:- start:1390 stop:1569 length:180 start_codon:yes stop_codon:yes gene_type:complete